jgi:hypothetical protein
MNFQEKENIIFYEFKSLIRENLNPQSLSSEKQNKIQEKLDSILSDYEPIFLELKPEELLTHLITAYNNWFYLDAFYPIIEKVLGKEKHFDMPKEVYNLVSIMNEFASHEKLQPIVKNFVKTIDYKIVQNYSSDNYKEQLSIDFLTIFAENNAWGIDLKEKSFLWELSIYTTSADFAKWLDEKEVIYDRCLDDNSGFNMLLYYNINTDNIIDLSNTLYKQEMNYRQTNNLDISFSDVMLKTIEEGNYSFFNFLISKGYDLSKPSFEYYHNIIDKAIAESGSEKELEKIKKGIVLEEKKYLENQIENPTSQKKQLKL